MRFSKVLVGMTALVALSGLAACGSGGSSGSAATTTTTTAGSAMAGPGTTGGAGATDMAQFGSACSQVPASGAGSFAGMAQAPVATAASNNPILSTLVTAVKKANLVDTLNSQQAITVFAPDNAAFGKIPADTLNQVLANNSQLTKILTYHVVPGRITPAQLASGNFTTLEGGSITTSGTGQDYTVNGSAHVICGNVQTANATVYIIDGVLMPSS
jgi:uncharacterized surface protein with fasciclin (FAS1) repeats